MATDTQREMKRIAFDPEAKKKVLDATNTAKDLIQNALDAYDKLGLKAKMTMSDIIDIQDGEGFIRETIYQESETLKSLPIRKDAALAMIQLPEDTKGFIEAIERLRRTRTYASPEIIWSTIQQDKAGEKVYINEQLEIIADRRASTYTRNEKDLEIYEFFEDLHPKLKALVGKYPDIEPFGTGVNNSAILRAWTDVSGARKLGFYPKSILK